jgi:hypothetical protein
MTVQSERPLRRLPFYAVISVLCYWVPFWVLRAVDPHGYDHAGMGLIFLLPVIFAAALLACLDVARLFRHGQAGKPFVRGVALALAVIAVSPFVTVFVVLVR